MAAEPAVVLVDCAGGRTEIGDGTVEDDFAAPRDFGVDGQLGWVMGRDSREARDFESAAAAAAAAAAAEADETPIDGNAEAGDLRGGWPVGWGVEVEEVMTGAQMVDSTAAQMEEAVVAVVAVAAAAVAAAAAEKDGHAARVVTEVDVRAPAVEASADDEGVGVDAEGGRAVVLACNVADNHYCIQGD
ncbi:hypothetical protein P691DRAFT_766929 [Macrolepiota fuliginosa MF-IS2]|uniref:Uncharacterized protein n=1 Tax=Macrolepiota fuliginosa MF-IS2 TaxID=1400762 RepID=A0A9P5X022_9AGAR|nr:hypothetical protein P691DRAFT_766929 [Macrolepiota fuliginosa MF-IS2]